MSAHHSREGHTATPFCYFVGNGNGRGLIRIEADNLSADAGQHIASMPRGDASEATAAFIVRACNSHDDLLAAMKEIVHAATYDESDLAVAILRARAAIARAEGAI